MTIDDQIRILERFNEKVDRLKQRGFAEEAKGGGSIIEFQRGRGWDGIHVGPTETTIEATVLTLRFFINNNERTSLSNMDSLYSNLDIEPQLAIKFRDIRNWVNSYLDTQSNLSISEEGPITHRQVFDLFLNGDLAHANDTTTEANYRSIRQTAFFPLFRYDFTETILLLVSASEEIQKINHLALDQLGPSGTP